MTKSSIGIKNVRIIDPYNNMDNVLDILIENGKITNIAEDIFSQSGNSNSNLVVIDGSDKIDVISSKIEQILRIVNRIPD